MLFRVTLIVSIGVSLVPRIKMLSPRGQRAFDHCADFHSWALIWLSNWWHYCKCALKGNKLSMIGRLWFDPFFCSALSPNPFPSSFLLGLTLIGTCCCCYCLKKFIVVLNSQFRWKGHCHSYMYFHIFWNSTMLIIIFNVL